MLFFVVFLLTMRVDLLQARPPAHCPFNKLAVDKPKKVGYESSDCCISGSEISHHDPSCTDPPDVIFTGRSTDFSRDSDDIVASWKRGHRRLQEEQASV